MPQIHSHSTHRKVLKEAFRLVWQNKWLWILGFFAAFWSNREAFRLISSSFEALNQTGQDFDKALLPMFENFKTLGIWSLPTGLIILVLIVIFLTAFLWLATASRGGLIFAAGYLNQGKKITNREALARGTEKIWPVFGLSLLGKIIVWLLSAGLLALIIKFATAPFPKTALFVFVLSFILLVLAALIISLVTIYAIAFVMLKNMSAGKSLAAALGLFFRNWLISLELGIILYALGFFISFALLTAGLILAVPVFLLFFILLLISAPSWLFWLAAVPVATVFVLFLLAFGAAFSFFSLTAWTKLFQELTEKKVVSKLIRLFHRGE